MTTIYWELFENASWQVTVQIQKEKEKEKEIEKIGDMNTESALENKTSRLS